MLQEDIISIIPNPLLAERHLGNFTIKKDTRLLVDKSLKQLGEYFCTLIRPATGSLISPELTIDHTQSNNISFTLDNSLSDIGEEGYKLFIDPSNVLLSAFQPAGIFYGIQTLRSLLPTEIESSSLVEGISWDFPAVKIIDYPRFPWRGFMLDVGRHFFGLNTLKLIIDTLSFLKMNKLHLHLTEDQGWRLAIDKYPLLTEIGSKRSKTQTGGIKSFLRKKYTKTPHEGFFTKVELTELIAYAQERFIEVIPEIDLPGHSMAMLAAYPHLGCTGGPYEVQTTFGIKSDVLCPGKEAVFDFLENIMDEIMSFFPSSLIHTGGDEASKKRWKNCACCQKRILEEKMLNEYELQTYFTNRLASYLIMNNHKPICWNDTLSNDLNSEIIIQYWLRKEKELLQHLETGRKVIMSHFFHTYLDYNYYITPLQKTYFYEPIPKKLGLEYHSNILGVEAPLWTEWVGTNSRLFWQLLPRLAAIAEVGWTAPEKKDYKSFKERLNPFYQRLSYKNIQGAPLNKVDPGKLKRLILPIMIFTEPKI